MRAIFAGMGEVSCELFSWMISISDASRSMDADRTADPISSSITAAASPLYYCDGRIHGRPAYNRLSDWSFKQKRPGARPGRFTEC